MIKFGKIDYRKKLKSLINHSGKNINAIKSTK